MAEVGPKAGFVQEGGHIPVGSLALEVEQLQTVVQLDFELVRSGLEAAVGSIKLFLNQVELSAALERCYPKGVVPIVLLQPQLNSQHHC